MKKVPLSSRIIIMKPRNNEFYIETFRLRTNDFDKFDHLTPFAIMDLFQDVAGTHAGKIGMGFQELLKKDLIWVLLRTKYEVLKYPPLYSTVQVKTWPKPKGKVDFDREYEIYNEEGELLVKGISKWVIVNKTTRRLSLSRDINYNCDEYKYTNYNESFNKLEDFDIEGLSFKSQMTTFLDLDHNDHINNCNYAKYIINSIELNEDDLIKKFEINYIKEVHQDTIIKNYYKKDGKIIYVKGIINNDEVSYIAKIELI